MDIGISGKTALVTGGATGIGKAVGALLKAEGAQVILVDRDGDKVSKAARECGDGVFPLHTDFRYSDQINGLLETIRQRFEMPEILVCARGPEGARGNPLELSDSEWEDAWRSDVMSVVRTARCFLQPMVRNGWGRMVVVLDDREDPENTLLSIARSALADFTRGLASRHARDNVLVSAVSTAAPKAAARAPEGIDRKTVDALIKKAGEFVDDEERMSPQEVAAAVVLACSGQAEAEAGSEHAGA